MMVIVVKNRQWIIYNVGRNERFTRQAKMMARIETFCHTDLAAMLI